MAKKYGAVNETAKSLKMVQSTVARIVRKGEERVSRRSYVTQGRDLLKKVDDFWKKFIRETV